MPVIRLKKSLDTKPKPTPRRLKENEGRVSSPDRVNRTEGRFPSSNGRDEKTESDVEYHKKSRARQESESQFKGENRRFVRERNEGEVEKRGGFRTGQSVPQFKGENRRFVRERNEGEVEKRGGFRTGQSVPQFKGENHRFVRERNEGEVEKRGGLRTEKSVYQFKGENRRFIREGNEGEVEKRGGFRTELDHRRRSRADDRRDFGEDKKPPFARSWNRNPSATEGMNPRKDFSYDKKGKYDNLGRFDRKPSYGKRRSFEEEDSDTETDGGEQFRDLRGYRVKKGVNRRGKDSSKSEKRGTSVEVSRSKLPSEGRKRDGVMSTDKRRGDAEVKLVEKHPNGKDKSDRVSDQKPDEHQARPPKPRNRIASPNKSLDDGPATTTPPKKRRKRIRLDPYDISNKRLDDSVPENDQNQQIKKSVDKEGEIKISMNAQFRAIQPSPTILSVVEDNLVGRRRSVELRNAGYYNNLSAPLDNIPFSSEYAENPERQRIEENVFRNKLEFFAAAKISSSFPPTLLPEIAFAGRSNVGKSSLLNALTRQWGVVRTSDKPGYTQTINFFRLASKLSLVDLPGYGFAYAKEEVKDAWEELVKEYVSTRVGLGRVCLLIDTKWGMKPRDHELIDLMERSQTPYQIVLTKTDAVFPIDVARRAMQIGENLKTNKSIVNPVMMVSSKSGAGIRSLRTVLSKLGRFIKP